MPGSFWSWRYASLGVAVVGAVWTVGWIVAGRVATAGEQGYGRLRVLWYLDMCAWGFVFFAIGLLLAAAALLLRLAGGRSRWVEDPRPHWLGLAASTASAAGLYWYATTT